MKVVLAKIKNKIRFLSLKHYWKNRVKKYGDFSVINISHNKEELKIVTEFQKETIFPIFSSQLRKTDKTVLDFGCGPGRFSFELANITEGKVIAVDIVPTFIKNAPKHESIEYKLLLNNRIPVSDESVDVIWVCLVLGGIKDRKIKRIVKEFSRVLKQNGMLFIIENTTNRKNLPYWFFRTVEEYVKIFDSVAKLRHLLDYYDMGEKISIMSARKNEKLG